MTDDPTADDSHEEIDPTDGPPVAPVDPVAATLDGEPDPLDELISALLDGELRPNEARPDLDDPEISRRHDELRGVAEAVGGRVPPLSADLVDSQIARALVELPAAADAPTSLTVARARRSTTLADRLPVIGAAAAFVLVAVGLGAILLSGGDDDDSVADGASVEQVEFETDAAADAGGGADEAGDTDVAAAEAPAETEATEEAEVAEATTADDGAADEADDDLRATPADPAVELSDGCRDDLLASVGATSVISAVDRGSEPAEVVLERADGSVVTALVDLGLCGTGRDVDPVIEVVGE